MATQETLNILGLSKKLSHDLEELSLEDHTAVLGLLQVLHQRRAMTLQQELQKKKDELAERQQKAYEDAIKQSREAREKQDQRIHTV